MDLEEVTEKSKITFPWDLTIGQLDELINHISLKLRAKIKYESLHSKEVGYIFGYSSPVKESVLKVTGNITFSNPPFAYDSFKIERSHQDISNLSAIQFSLTPDWEIADYKEKPKLWMM